METPPASLAAIKKSAYARSRTFRLGVGMLAGAAALIAWHAVRDSLIAKRENLRTVEGTVVEHRSSETSGTSRVKLAKDGTQSIQGSRQLKTVLRIQKRDGAIVEFTASEWFPTPKAGWERQPIRVQHDSLGYLYEIVVAGEVIRDVETSWRNRKIRQQEQHRAVDFSPPDGSSAHHCGISSFVSAEGRPAAAAVTA